jgi:hypothetical protein
MFGNQYQKKNLSKKIIKTQSKKRIKHKGVGKVSSVNKIKSDRIIFLKNRFDQIIPSKDKPKYEALYNKIIKIGGGDVVVPAIEPNIILDDLITNGKVIDSEIRLIEGFPEGDCHNNSSCIFVMEGIPRMTGYALTKDEDGLLVWRQHSWNIETENGKRTILDSTWREKGLKYFGIEMGFEKYKDEDVWG